MKLEYKNDDLTFNYQRQENGKYDKFIGLPCDN